MFAIIVMLLTVTLGNAQVTTNSGSGLNPTYPDLATAITALNGATITSAVTITLAGNETAPVGGYSITAQGTATNTILIQGSTSTITASNALVAGTLTDAVFKLVGADYVTLQNFTMQENAANLTTAAATNNMTEWGVALLYATATNGAQNNTIQNNTISLNRVYQNTFGIYSNSTHTAIAATTSVTATSATGGNHGLKIYTNAISNVNNGIVVVGPTAVADQNTGVDIGGGSLATANTITNYGTTGTFSGYANVSGTVNGILVRNSNGTNVSYNTITSSVGGVTVGTLNGIQFAASSNAPTSTFTNTINNNNISLKPGAAGIAMNGINYPSGSASATSTLNITSNDFNNFGHTVSGTAAITFILTLSTNQFTTINNNSFTNITVNTTGSITFISHDYSIPATGSLLINNNSIVTGFAKTGPGGSVILTTSNATSGTGSINNYINNNFSNITLTGATSLTGFNNTDGGTGSTKTVTGNVFNNWTTGLSAINAMNFTYWNGVSSLSNNTITNLNGQAAITGVTIGAASSAATSIDLGNNIINNLVSSGTGGAVVGIRCGNTSTGITISGNVINTLSSSGAAAVSGILISGANAAGTNVFKNKIYDLSGSNASSTVNGLLISGGTLVTAYNNIIGDLRTPNANATNPLNGINITGGTTVNVYNNTVMLNATSSGALFGSSTVSVSTTPTVTLRNNIFVNTSSANGAGLAVAYRRSSTTLTSYTAASDNNIFFGINIFTDGTNTDATLVAYKTRVASRDAASQTENTSAFFQSTTGSDANYLRIPIGTTTFAESGAILITTPLIDTDYWNVTRPFSSPVNGGTAVDIGASEFDGIPNLPSCAAPVDQATALVLGVTTTTTTAGSFTAAASTPTGYLVVASTGALSVNPTDGIVYAPGNVLGNGIVLQAGTGLSYSGTGLTGNTAYTITVFSYNSTACVGGPKYLTMAPLTGTVTTCPTAPTVLVNSLITSSGFTASWTAPAGGSAGVINYTMDVATDAGFTTLVAGSPISVGTATTQSVTGLTSAVTYYIRIKANNGVCDGSYLTGSATTLCIPASFTTTDGTRCGTGTVALSAAPSSGNMVWYAASTGGTPLYTGNTFNTPSISATTQYYAESQLLGAVVTGARPAPTNIANTTPSSYGLVFDVTSGFTLNSVDVFNGTTTAGTFVIQLQNNVGTVLQTSGTFTAPAGTGVIGTTIAYTANLGWNIPVGTGYRLLVTSGTASLIRESALGGFPYALGTVGSITSGYIGGNSTTYYYLYNWKVQTICASSPRTMVTATVTSAPTLTVSSNVSICNGTSTPLTVSSANDPNYTYTWSPATGLSTTTGASVTANPTTTTVYTVTANDAGSGCATTGTVTVTVNVAPTAVTVTPATATICPNTIQTLVASGGNVTGVATIGTVTTLTTSTGEQTAFCNRRLNYWSQTIYTAAELSAAGVTAGNITAMAYNITTIGDAATNANFTVKIGASATSSFASTSFVSTASFTTVYGPSTYTHTATGWQTITFATPYVWDGISDIVVNVTHDGIDNINNAQTYYTATSDNKSLYGYNYTGATTTGTLSLNRLDIRFDYIAPVAVTWSPTIGLYTDAGATVAYTGTAVTTVYAKPSTNQTYTATATLGTCTKANTSAITVTTVNNTVAQVVDTLTANQAGATYQWFTCPGNVAISGETAQSFTATATGDYGVTVTFSGCSVDSACITISTLGVNTFDVNSGFKAYPNPVNNILNIEYTSDLSNVSVYNLLGQQVLTKKVTATSTQIDMSGLNAGTYLVKVEANDASKTIKVVKR
jgi:hypothetical protein